MKRKRAPSPEELLAAKDRTLPDLIAMDLRVLVCGINPSLYSAAVGAHFARPGNRFWPALARAGITARVLKPSEQHELLAIGYGITNVVERPTSRADELAEEELTEGAKKLTRKVRRYKPRVLAVLGASAYRVAFGHKKASIGVQREVIGDTRVWVLPNPSGLNAHYQVDDLAQLYGELHQFVTTTI